MPVAKEKLSRNQVSKKKGDFTGTLLALGVGSWDEQKRLPQV